MKFMVTIYVTDDSLAAMQNELSSASEEAHRLVQDELRASGELVETNELSLTRARTVRQTADGLSVTDGPFAETKEFVGGYYLIDCPDIERAVEIAGRFVEARFAPVEVRALGA
jgi:hypothetical protein